MTRCWSLEPTHRPTFKLLCQLIDGLLQCSDDAPPQVRSLVSRGAWSLANSRLSFLLCQQSYRNINECEKEDLKGGIPQKTGGEEGERRQRGNLPATSRATLLLWRPIPSSRDLLREPGRRWSPGAGEEHLPAVVTVQSDPRSVFFFYVKCSKIQRFGTMILNHTFQLCACFFFTTFL